MPLTILAYFTLAIVTTTQAFLGVRRFKVIKRVLSGGFSKDEYISYRDFPGGSYSSYMAILLLLQVCLVLYTDIGYYIFFVLISALISTGTFLVYRRSKGVKIKYIPLLYKLNCINASIIGGWLSVRVACWIVIVAITSGGL